MLRKNTSPLHIMDVTIREGSCANSFSFTPEDVSKIVSRLSDAGVDYIEASHGLGLGSHNINVPAGGTDKEYAEAAFLAKGNSKVGAIGHYKWTKLEDIEAVAKHLDFFRIATIPGVTDNIKPYIEKSKELGLETMVQVSRSSQIDKNFLVDSVKELQSFGADVVYIVDTTGCFTPDETETYVKQVRKKTKGILGFHAHNTLSLAMANTIKAIENGCSIVDASLLGLGRDAGNVPIEALAIVLDKLGIPHSLSLKKLIEAGEDLVAPILQKKAVRPWYALYLAAHRKDFWPYSILEFIAKNTKKDIWEVLDKFIALQDGLEFDEKEYKRLTEALGANPEEELEKLQAFKDAF